MARTKLFNLKSVSFIMLQSVFYGIGNPLGKIAYESVTPFWMLTFRFSIALLIFFLFYGNRIISQLKTAKFSQYLPASVCMALAYISSNVGLNWTSATNVGFLTSLPIIFTPLLALVILHKKYDYRYLPFQAFVLIGLYLLCGNDGVFKLNIGDIFALFTAIALSGSLVLSKRSLESVDAVTISATQTGVATFLSLICALVFDGFSIVPNITLAAWGIIVYAAVTCTCIAYVLQNSALVHLSSGTVSMLQCTQPILTALCSFIILGETMSFRGILGGFIIVGSILVTNLLRIGENGSSDKISNDYKTERNV